MEEWNGRERRRQPRLDPDCPLEDMVLSHEHVLFGDRKELTVEQIARGEGGGLIALTRQSREVSDKNNKLIRVLLGISTASLFGQAVPWKTVGSFFLKLLVP